MNSRERRRAEAEAHNYERWLMVNAPQSQRFDLLARKRRPSAKTLMVLGALAGFSVMHVKG